MREPDDRLAHVHERLAQAVEAITTGEDWAAMLAVAARFRSYSPNNVFLITLSRPDATRVAGYTTWKALGRQVRSGEKGIPILAPVLRRPSMTNRGHGYIDPEDDIPGPVLVGFRVAHVFDVSQTEGEPMAEVSPQLLDGSSPEGAFQGLADHLVRRGFTVERAPLAPANGVTDYLTRTVIVADRLSDAAAFKTLAHEAGHVHLHGDRAPAGLTGDRAEVEAESVAFIVCAELGLRSDDYSFLYVAQWARGEKEVVAESATRAISAARSVLDAIAPTERPPGPAARAALGQLDRGATTAIPSVEGHPVPSRIRSR